MRSPARTRAVAAALAAALAVPGCSTDPDETTQGSTEGLSIAPSTVVSGPVDSGPADGSGDGGTPATTGGGEPHRPPTTTPPATKPTPRPTTDGRPEIVYFRVQRKPSCPAGTTVNPVPGSPVVLEWQARDVDRVALSVDGPGVYADNYPPTGTETLTFPCSGEEGDTQRHTYQLTVTNAEGKRTRTIEVTATVHTIAPV
ncbi:hypothetical protein [Micromonospora sagamiensis]|uniref:Ig-like domain-containing protein n=1 Tax=Micromonospora sagamiensis TaxID=47875 RepID=A0A562WGD4_9ACTN|nr:hypothetical protein [Micromonospora sagamiensis]TWJ29370.1 hypothetical protein JD81_02880 [Micromonospora sagamiensis]BCL17602.1 hypothetical protein GCM10017556_53410 [Micromonospora sagamiensis]